MSPFRQPLLLLSRSDTAKALLTKLPLASDIVARFVPGETRAAAVAAARELADRGIHTTLDHLGEDTTDAAQADRIVEEYLALLDALAAEGLAPWAEVSVKLTAIGLDLPGGRTVALENARRICRAAHNAGTTVTLDMEDHTTTDDILTTLRDLRQDFPETGVAVQAYLHRTEMDCRSLARGSSRVRLCKGAYDEPDDVAFASPAEVDRAFVRSLKVLLDGEGYPMIATHDPRLIEITHALVSRYGRAAGTYEFQMLYGCRPDEQQRLADAGERVRIYLPYGSDWYGYLVRRLAERPRNLSFFLTALVSKK